jgi:DNA-binding transcriptional LysR family regulator
LAIKTDYDYGGIHTPLHEFTITYHLKTAMTVKKIPLEEMDWDDLRIFLAVMRTETLSQAAKRLKLDHSTVCRRIAQFELCLGGSLFERHRAGMKPTELARRILENADAVEAAVLNMHESLSDSNNELVGTVRIAMMEGIASLYLARRLLPFIEQYPRVKLELVTSSQILNINRREAEIFLSFFQPTGRNLHCELVGQITLNLYGATNYFARYGKPKTIGELTNHHFTSYIEDLVQIDAVRWLDDVISEPKIRFFSNSMVAQMTAASAGIGLVLLPRFAVEKENDLFPVLENEVIVKRDLWISVHHDLEFSNRIKLTLQYIKQLLQADQAYLNGITQ